jgi:hypothetical protein
MRNVKPLLCMSVMLLAPGLYAQAPSKQAPERKAEATVNLKVSPRFKEAAEDAYDAVRRALSRGPGFSSEATMSDHLIYQLAKLEASRLCDKANRIAVTAQEKKVAQAVEHYFIMMFSGVEFAKLQEAWTEAKKLVDAME